MSDESRLPSVLDASEKVASILSKVNCDSTIIVDVDMSDAVSMREHLMERWEKSLGIRPSLYHMVVKAAATVLKEHHTLDLGSVEHGLLQWQQVDIGVTIFVEDDDAVVTPVIRDAGSMTLAQIATQLARLTERASERRLTDEETSGGTITVSNLGKCGVDVMALFPNPSEAAVLGVGRCMKKALVVEDELKIRWLMSLSLSFDRRAIPETRAARFVNLVRELLERPTLLTL